MHRNAYRNSSKVSTTAVQFEAKLECQQILGKYPIPNYMKNHLAILKLVPVEGHGEANTHIFAIFDRKCA
jgi:hypothetical protein